MTNTIDVLREHQSSNFSSNVNIDGLKHFSRNAKAQRWLLCEWFYSDIDRCLLAGENEFANCLEHFFPELQPKKPLELTRKQWSVIRKRFGKPRRLSANYLANERMKLAKQRQLLRIVQNERKTHYPSERIFLHHLPAVVISAIPVASRVVVRLFRSAQFALYHGQVISRNATYQILIDDANIGLINVNDEDLMSERAPEPILLSEKLKTIQFGDKDKEYLHSDNDEDFQNTDEEETEAKSNLLSQIPDRLLYLIIRVSRILCAKRDSIESLKKMNDQAEFEISRHIPLSDLFKRDYAQLIQWLATLNEHLAKFILEINQICRELVTDEQLLAVFNDTKFVCERSQKLANELVQRLNIPAMITSETNIQLITRLVALVVQMKDFSESEGSFLELHAIDEANATLKQSLHPSLLSSYEQCVESRLIQFKSGLNNRPGLGLLKSFLQSQSDRNPTQSNPSSINQTFFSN